MNQGAACGKVVAFNYQAWLFAYPEFGNVLATQATEFFNRACLLCDNTPSSPITNIFTRTLMLNAATAHFAYLFAPQTDGSPRPVGRISQATQGSVSAGFEYKAPQTDTEAFWNQSPYGAYFWTASLPYRSFRYQPSLLAGFGFPGYFPGRGRGFI